MNTPQDSTEQEFNKLVNKLGVAGGVTSSAGVELREYFHDTHTKNKEKVRAEERERIREWCWNNSFTYDNGMCRGENIIACHDKKKYGVNRDDLFTHLNNKD